MSLIPRPTGYLENPLNQTLFGNTKEIATAGTTDAIETNTNQINLLPGSLAPAIAVSDDLELTSPAKLKFQTDAVLQVGVGANLEIATIPSGSLIPDALFYDPITARVTYDTAPPAGNAWSTVPAGGPVNFANNNIVNANNFLFGATTPQIDTDQYRATVTNQIDLAAAPTQFISATPTQLTIESQAPNDQIHFNGPVALNGSLVPPGQNALVSYNAAGDSFWANTVNLTAGTATTITNIIGPVNSVFAQFTSSGTDPITAAVGETYLAVDAENRIQWLTQNTQAMNPNDMFPENTQTPLAIRPTVGLYFRSTVLGLDGLVYCLPGGAAPRTASTIDPTNNSVVNNVFDITPANAFPRYSIAAPNGKIYMLPLTAVVTANPFFFPIYDTITKTLDISLPAPWITGAGAVTGALDTTGRYIWMPPQAETAGQGQRVRRFDTVTNTTIETGSNYPSASFQNNKWGTAVLCPDGDIICFPFNARTGSPAVAQALKIETATGNTTLFPLTGVTAGNTMYYGGCLSPDGNYVYVSPQSASNVLKWDWRTNTFTEPAGLAVGAFGGTKYGGMVAATNSLIYMLPWDETNIQVIDPATDTFITSIPVTNSAVLAKYGDGVLTPNGKIISAPHSANDGAGNLIATIIKTGIPTIPNWMLGPGINAQ